MSLDDAEHPLPQPKDASGTIVPEPLGRKFPLPSRNNSTAAESDPVPELRRMLGHAAVFIRWPKGTKAAPKKWKHLRQRDMTASYLARLKNGNIGVALGDVSGNLCAIDIDADGYVEPFLAANPQLSDTFQTHGSRGRVFWIRVKGDYPRQIKKLKADGKDIGEWRGDGGQSIVWGVHPATKELYEWIVKTPAVEIDFASIRWPDGVTPAVAPQPLLEGGLSKGEDSNGDVSNGSPLCNCNAVGGVVASVAPDSFSALPEHVRVEIDRAVKLGLNATEQNNSASFHACVALIQIRGVEDLAEMPIAERRYFAERWYQELQTLGRIKKPKTHYLNDIFSSIKHAKQLSMNTTSPIRQAWLLAQTRPLPPEAKSFAGDDNMQRLIALCYQLHALTENGEWFLARNTVGKLMELDATATRNLSENFNVLVECGILEVVKPYEQGKRQATVYRYVEQS